MNVPIPMKKVSTIKEANQVVGTLSKPSKMPGRAWGISPKLCHRGSKLRLCEGTVCSGCYALKGNYRFPGVEKSHATRYAAFIHRRREEWVSAMALLIDRQCKVPYFRIFDSGDLASTGMLEAWMEVARRLPTTSFWLSTRERLIVKQVLSTKEKPANLVIRVSADMIDGPAPKGFSHSSRVSKVAGVEQWRKQVELNNEGGEWKCPSPLQGGECKDCRACWDSVIETVTYKQH